MAVALIHIRMVIVFRRLMFPLLLKQCEPSRLLVCVASQIMYSPERLVCAFFFLLLRFEIKSASLLLDSVDDECDWAARENQMDKCKWFLINESSRVSAVGIHLHPQC